MPDQPERLLIACFCAAWCRTCDDYEQVFDRLRVSFGARADFAWVDIEDQSDVLDNVDVENFPTLLISGQEHVYFWGTLLPHEGVAVQMIQRALSGDFNASTTPDVALVNQRLRATLAD
jgi:thioredoxin 1